MSSLFPIALGIVLALSPARGFATLVTLLGEFDKQWDAAWNEKHFTESHNRFEIVTDGDDEVLCVTSDGSAGGLFRDIDDVVPAQLSWRWKIARSLSENVHETEKKGDDYVARVFVTFEKSFFRWRTRAICYVWAGNEPIGHIYKNPYAGNVKTVVLQSGDEFAGSWLTETRDLVADYIECFGETPSRLSGVALMVDTDQTKSDASACFDDICLQPE